MKKMGLSLALAFLLIIALPQNAQAAHLLIPGGQVIGMALENGTVSVAAFDETLGAAAKSAGLQVGDRILKLDTTPITCPEDLRAALSKSDGTVELTIQRGARERKLRFCPAATQDGPKLGVYLKQGVTGIGTVTWYDPESGTFGALGHGVNTNDGSLLVLKEGSIYHAQVLSVKKGKIGDPGQLLGAITDTTPIGDIQSNTHQGVFGTVDDGLRGEPLPAADTQSVHTGGATILSTIGHGTPQEYSVEILKIYPAATATGRNMLIRVTDPQLLASTGGIVQGMSGSPIIQDGKLIGAVTHVLVNDPTMGYGIFIENMLDAAA